METFKRIILWLTLALACFFPASALTVTAPENHVWEIFSIGYDAATPDASPGYDSTVRPSFAYDSAPIHSAVTKKIPTEANHTLFGQNAEFKAAEDPAPGQVEEEAGPGETEEEAAPPSEETPPPAAAEGTTTLYRSVSEAELRDVAANGLQQGAGSMGNKWFAESAADAAQWGKTFFKFDKEPVFTLQVQVPDSVAAQMMRNASLDGIGPARSADGAVLQMINEQGSIKVLNGNVIPK